MNVPLQLQTSELIRLAAAARASFDERLLRLPLALRVGLHLAADDERASHSVQQRKLAEKRVIDKKLREIGGEYARLIRNSLATMGISHITHEDKHKKVNKIKYLQRKATLEAIYLEVNIPRLPGYCTIDMMLDPAVLRTLSFACRRVVRPVYEENHPERGFWFMVELKQGVRGIPRIVDYDAMLKSIREGAPPLSVPMGVGEAGKMIIRDIYDMPHMLVGGATQQGKSVFIKMIACTLAQRNSPDMLKILGVDLKYGAELKEIDRLPHMMFPLVKRKEEVLPLLKLVMQEVERRLKRFEELGVVNINGYNQRHTRRMARWVVIIDELANLMLDRTMRNDAEMYLSDIAAMSRAAGIHLIVATQRPSTDVVTGLIKANFPVRVAFACSDNASSKTIIDTTEASKIGEPGRMILAMGRDKTELQTPWLSPEMMNEIIDDLCTMPREQVLEKRKRHNLTVNDILRFAIEHYNSTFPVKPLFETLRVQGVSRTELERIAQKHENTEFELDGAIYRMTPTSSDPKTRLSLARKIELVRQLDDSSLDTNADSSLDTVPDTTNDYIPTMPASRDLYSPPVSALLPHQPDDPQADEETGEEVEQIGFVE